MSVPRALLSLLLLPKTWSAMQNTDATHGKYSKLASLIVGYFAIGLDSYLVILALPSISKGMHISFDDAGWILLVLLVARQFSVLISGRLGDRYGRKSLFIYGAALFGFGAILSTIAPGYWVLLLFRVFQGIAAGMMEANFPALVTVSFPAEERGKALGIASASIALSALVGVILSGIICESVGWRYIFIAVVPFCAAAVPLVIHFVPESTGFRGTVRDAPGQALLLSTLSMLALFLTYGTVEKWDSPATIVFLALTVLGVVFLVIQEKRARTPMVSVKLLKVPTFTVSILCFLAVATCQMMVYLTVPYLLDYYVGMTTESAGLMLVIALGTSLFFLVPSGLAADFIGTRSLELAGMFLIAVSLSVLAFVGSQMTVTTIAVSLALLGLGSGLFASPNYSAVMGSSPRASLGIAGSLYGTVGIMGTFFAFALSDAVLGRWGDIRESAEGVKVALNNPLVHDAMRDVFIAAFFVALAGLGVCFVKFWLKPASGFERR